MPIETAKIISNISLALYVFVEYNREAAGLSQDAAAALLYKARGTWAQWEAREGSPNHRAMDPAFWELFQLKARPKPG